MLKRAKQNIYEQVMQFLEHRVQINGQFGIYVQNDAVDKFAKTGIFKFGVITTINLEKVMEKHQFPDDYFPTWAEEVIRDNHMLDELYIVREMRKTGSALPRITDDIIPEAQIEVSTRFYKKYYKIMAPFGLALDLGHELPDTLVRSIHAFARQQSMKFLEGGFEDGEISVLHFPFWPGFRSYGLGE